MLVARTPSAQGAYTPMSNQPANERTELWVWCAYALVLAGVTGLVYLGSRPAGDGPVRVYLTGPPVLALSALSVGLWGLLLALWPIGAPGQT